MIGILKTKNLSIDNIYKYKNYIIIMVEKIKFYDLKEKRQFTSDDYEIREMEVRGNIRKCAVAISPYSKKEYWRIIKQ